MIADRAIQIVLLAGALGMAWGWHGAASVRDQVITERDAALARNVALTASVAKQNEGVKQLEAVTTDALARASASEAALQPVLDRINAVGRQVSARPASVTCNDALARQRAAIEGLRK